MKASDIKYPVSLVCLNYNSSIYIIFLSTQARVAPALQEQDQLLHCLAAAVHTVFPVVSSCRLGNEANTWSLYTLFTWRTRGIIPGSEVVTAHDTNRSR